MERDVTRCEKHGLHYDAKMTRGCVICKREAGGAEKPLAKPGATSKARTSPAGRMLPLIAVAVGVSVSVSATFKETPAGADEPFSMTPPPGWRQVDPKLIYSSPEAVASQFPEKHRATIARLIKELGARKNLKAYFVNLSAGASTARKFLETINVTELSSAPFIDDAFVAEARVRIPMAQAQAMPGVTYRLLDAQLFQLPKAPALRITARATVAGVEMHLSQYFVPGGDRAFMVTGSTLPESFARWEPIFDAAARTIRGAKQGVKTGFNIGRAFMAGAVSGGASAAAVFLVWILWRRPARKTEEAG